MGREREDEALALQDGVGLWCELLSGVKEWSVGRSGLCWGVMRNFLQIILIVGSAGNPNVESKQHCVLSVIMG